MAIAVTMVTFAFLSLGGHATAQTRAGTLIINQARATIASTGTVVPSNQVVTVVRSVCAYTITPSGSPDDPPQLAAVIEGAEASLRYRLTNQGNDTFTFTLGWGAARSEWVPRDVTYYEDVNRTGRRDAGDPSVTRVELEPGASVSLVAVVTAPIGESGVLVLTPVITCEGTAVGTAASGHTGQRNRIATVGTDDGFAGIRMISAREPNVQSVVAIDDTGTSTPDGGRRVEVRVVTRNDGADADDVEVEIPLPEGACLQLDVDSIQSDGRGEVDILSPSQWTPLATFARDVASGVAPADVGRAMRLRLAALAGGEIAELIFAFDVSNDCGDATASIPVSARAGGIETRSEAVADLQPRPASTLIVQSEVGQPSVERLIVGQRACAPLRAENTGLVDDVYTVTVTSDLPPTERDAVTITLRNESELPIDPTFALDRSGATTVLACARANRVVDPFAISVRLVSTAGARVTTRRLDVREILSGDALILDLALEPGGLLGAGARSEVTAIVRNTFPFSLEQVDVRLVVLRAERADGTPLSAPFTLGSVTPALVYDPDDGSVRWEHPLLQPGFEGRHTFTLVARDDLPDDAFLELALVVRSNELAEVTVSEGVQLDVWSNELLVEVASTPERPGPGEIVQLTATLANPSTQRVDATVTLELPETEPRDLQVLGDSVARSLDLPAGAREEATYALRVAPTAVGEIIGHLVVASRSDRGVDLSTQRIAFRIVVDPGVFERRRGTVTGYVFADEDGNGRYDPGLDQPLRGVRLLTPDGRFVTTDARGRYLFGNLALGSQWLVPDPATIPTALADAATLRAGTYHRFDVTAGLTRLDVPVEPLGARLREVRSRIVRYGPVQVEQTRELADDGVLRIVTVHSEASVARITLRWRDPDEMRTWTITPGSTADGVSASRTFALPAATPERLPDIDVEWGAP